MCGNAKCECFAGHFGHSKLLIHELVPQLRQAPPLPEQYAKAERLINELVDSSVANLQALKLRHHEHIRAHMGRFRSQESLRQRLVNNEQLENGATGAAVCRMLRELREVREVSNPYYVTSDEVKEQVEATRRLLGAELRAVELLWSANFKLTNLTVAASEIKMPRHV